MAKPDPIKFAASKLRLQRGLRKIIATHEQIRTDIEWWNANRTDAEPFDVGGDIAVVALARQVLALVNAERPIPKVLWDRLQGQIEANATEDEATYG